MQFNLSARFGALMTVFSCLISFLCLTEFPVPAGFTVTAHTGCFGLKENSIEAIEAGIKAGAQIVEFDLQFTDSGEPVLSHDVPEEACVPLSDAFACLQKHPHIRANIDVKNTAHLECIPALAQAYGVTPQIFFTGIEADNVAAVLEKCPGIPYYLNADIHPFTDLNALAEHVAALGAVGVNIKGVKLSPRLTNVFHDRNLLVSVWTIDSRLSARYVLSMQPDNVTTRRPDLIRTYILSKEALIKSGCARGREIFSADCIKNLPAC